MSILWMIINFSDIQSLLILIFINMQYKVYSTNIFIKIFIKVIVIINLIVVVYIFEKTYYAIFEYLLIASF